MDMDLQSTSENTRSYPSIRDYYNANSIEPEKPIQLQPGLSNFSCLVLGDDRIAIAESIMSAQMRVTVENKLTVPSPSKNKATHTRMKEYNDAKSRISDVDLDRLERLMKDKLVQRSAKSASMFQVMKAFKFFDRDQCNRISIEGFTRALEFLGFQYTEQQNLSLFARYDLDCTGEIDYGYFIASAMFEGSNKGGRAHGHGSTDSPSRFSPKSVPDDDYDANPFASFDDLTVEQV